MEQGEAPVLLLSSDEESKVVRKLDRHLVLLVALLYLLSFLDRSNIGNARVAGLSKDLNLIDSQYEWLLTAFYFTYVLFEWMGFLYTLVPAHIYIALCVGAWGLVASAQSVANSFTSMVILRACLGISEAAYGPGIPLFMSYFFRREELGARVGMFIASAPLATSFASGLAWLIALLAQHSPFAPWRLLFLVEGFPSVIAAVFAWHLIPDSPRKARFLTARERHVAEFRLLRNQEVKGKCAAQEAVGLDWKVIGLTLLDPKCYITAFMFFSCNVAFSSLPPFLPTVINEMHFSPITAQILSAPPYLVAFATVLVISSLSDRFRVRSVFVITTAIMGAFGYAVIAVAGTLKAPSGWRYFGVFFASAGFFSAVTLVITWTVNNQRTDSGKGTAIVILNVCGQLGPLLGTRLYPDRDKPYFVPGMSICCGFMLLVAILAFSLRIVLIKANERDRIAMAYEMVRQTEHDEREQSEYGTKRSHDHTHFIFML